MIGIGLPTASRARVRGMRHARAAVDNPQPAGIALINTPGTVLTSGATSLYFIHTDHLNTPRLIADDQQRTVWRWNNTDPFGGNPPDENPSGLGAFEFPLRFPGQYADKETNLHYNYFRDYDPGGGRYIESDPIGLTGGLNTYVYVGGDPLRTRDFWGLKGCGKRRYESRTPDFFFKTCCDAHDDCYDDCANRPSKDSCDQAFTSCALRQCSRRWIVVKFVCETFAIGYSEAVRRDGNESFDESRALCPATCKR